MTRLFKPSVVVQLAGQTIGDPLFDQRGAHRLRVVFRVRRTLTSAPDSAQVQLYNLSEERRAVMSGLFHRTGKARLSIASGYDGVVSDLFAGDVRKLRAGDLRGSDVVTTIDADDGGDALANARLRGLSTSGLTADNMISAALAALAQEGEVVTRHPSVASVVASTVSSRSYFTVVSIGKATDLLDEAARILGARWWVRDGLLFMAQRGLPTDGVAVVLPRTHWLSEPTEDGKGLVHVPTFLDPLITPGRQVALQGRASAASVENFRCEAVEYRGDTEGGPWAADCTLRSIRVGG